MKVIIMAGGMGTRISSVRNDVPKPMIEICEKPILQYQIENLRDNGLTDITIVIGHLGYIIQNYFGDGSKFNVKIDYFIEKHPLGTAGALFKMNIKEDFLLLCGDTIFDIDFNRFITFHKIKNAWASLISHPNGHPYDSSLLVTEILQPSVEGNLPLDTKKVIKWLAKEDKHLFYKNRVNAGIELISPKLLDFVMKKMLLLNKMLPEKIDLDRDVLKTNINSGKIFAYDTPEYIKDMGTPDRYFETENDIKTGKIHSHNLGKKQKAIFLDRDGTINKENGFIKSVDNFELMDDAAESIKRINQSGFLAIVVTNQPVIARGSCSFEELQEIHNKMETELGKAGAYLDAIYYCPHHTDKGFPGERTAYKCNCNCRKPNPGLILTAAKDFNIDLTQSFMIGDSNNDIQAGNASGCKESFKIGEKKLLDIIKEII